MRKVKKRKKKEEKIIGKIRRGKDKVWLHENLELQLIEGTIYKGKYQAMDQEKVFATCIPGKVIVLSIFFVSKAHIFPHLPSWKLGAYRHQWQVII